MKKYKLIKEYPGSQKLGTVVLAITNCPSVNYKDESNEIYYSLDVIENNPEFWKKVKEEPNYLITAFRSIEHPNSKFENTVAKINSDGTFLSGIKIEDLLHGDNSVEDGCFEIYSVKNSKGEELTIGDNVKGYGEEFIVNSFEIGEHILGGCYVCGRNKRGNVKVSVELVEKCDKKPIFVSADGVEILDGE